MLLGVQEPLLLDSSARVMLPWDGSLPVGCVLTVESGNSTEQCDFHDCENERMKKPPTNGKGGKASGHSTSCF